MVNFALFGAGRIGVMHAANIAANPRARLAYVYDVNEAAARACAAKHKAKVAPSVDAVLKDKSVDAVLIASSTPTHVDLITASAKAGKAIMCEKPIDLDIKRVERCRKDIAMTGVPIQIGFNRRYDPSHRAVRDALRKGEIGALELLVITSRDPGLAPVAYLKTSGGIFRDMTIHDFDLARFILGNDPVVEVSAAGSVMVHWRRPDSDIDRSVPGAIPRYTVPSGAMRGSPTKRPSTCSRHAGTPFGLTATKSLLASPA